MTVMPSRNRFLILAAVLLLSAVTIWALSPDRKTSPTTHPKPPGPAETENNHDRPTTDTPAGPPRLAVLLVFDQLRGDYPERWDALFEDGGFRRFQNEGAWFKECHYPYAGTYTGPGHATLATGAAPDKHGIIAN